MTTLKIKSIFKFRWLLLLVLTLASVSLMTTQSAQAAGEKYSWTNGSNIKATGGIYGSQTVYFITIPNSPQLSGPYIGLDEGTTQKAQVAGCDIFIEVIPKDNGKKANVSIDLLASIGCENRSEIDKQLDKEVSLAGDSTSTGGNLKVTVIAQKYGDAPYADSDTITVKRNDTNKEIAKKRVTSSHKYTSEGLEGFKVNFTVPRIQAGYTACSEKLDTCNNGGLSQLLGGDGGMITITAGEAPSPEESTTSCAIDGIGWIVCPVMNFLAEMNDKAFGFLQNLLGIRPSLMQDEATVAAWSRFRDLANVAFVIAFLAIIYSQITSFGVSNYGIKKLLPKIAAAAILVNLSLFICQVLVDASNIAGASLYSFIEGIVPDLEGTSQDIGWGSTVSVFLAGGVSVLLIVALGAAPAVLLAVGLILLILIARQAFILILVIVAPLAFVAYLLPNTESMFKKWWKALTATLLVYPIIAVVFGASTLASNILMGIASQQGNTDLENMNDDSQMLAVVALTVMAIPLFAVPVILKSAMSGAGAIGAKLANWQDKANKRAGGQMKERAGQEYNSMKNRVGGALLQSNSRRARAAAFLTGTRRKANREARYKGNEELRSAAEEAFINREGSKTAARRGRVVEAQETANLNKQIVQNQAKQRHLDNNHDLHGRATTSGLDLHNAEETHKNLVGAAHMAQNPGQYDALNESKGVKQNQELETSRRFEGSAAGQALGVQRSGLEDQVATEKARQSETYKTSVAGQANSQARKAVEGQVKIADLANDLAFQSSLPGRVQAQQQKETEGELAIVQSEQNAEFKGSDQGVDIAIRQDAIKQVESAADTFAETAAVAVNTPVRLQAQAAKDSLAAAQAGEEALVQELRTDAGAAAHPAYADVAQELQAADISKRVQTQRAASANNVATGEYASQVETSAGVAGGLAEVAGGIDPYGARRAVSSASQVAIEQFGKNVTMEQSTMSDMAAHHSDPSKNLMEMVKDTSQSPERRAAAAGMIMKNGAMKEIHELLNVSQTLGTDEAAQGIRQIMMSDKNRTPFGLSSGDEAAMKRGEPMVDDTGSIKDYTQMLDDRSKKKLSDGKWAGLDPDDQSALTALALSGQLTGDSLQNLLDASHEAETNDNISTTTEAKKHAAAILAHAATQGLTPTNP